MLFDIENLRWDERICRRLGIPAAMLPAVRPCSEVYGTVNIQGVEVPIAGIAGDQQAALFRPDLLCRRRGQKHLRHRLLFADEHRRNACTAAATGC